jgi:hypothetical protein
MDWTTFLSHAIDALAWPIALLVVVLVLRRPLGGLVGTLHRLRWRDWEAEFGQEIEELEAAADRLPPGETEPSSGGETSATDRQTPETRSVHELARYSPPAALLVSWISVEEAIERAVRRLAISADPPWHVAPLRKIELLQECTDLDHDTAAVLHRLRVLRNRVAHAGGGEIRLSATETLEYHQAATRAIAALDRLQYVRRNETQTHTPSHSDGPGS